MTENLKILIEKYKSNTATESEKKIVEEKLTEYTLLQDLMLENEPLLEIPLDSETVKIDQKKMKRQINRKLTKLITLIMTLFISLGLIFYLLITPLLNHFYFNPNEKEKSAPIPTFNLVSSLYTELTNPAFRLNNVTSTKDGIGNYAISKTYDSTMDTLNPNAKVVSYSIKRNEVITPYEAFLPVVAPIAKLEKDTDTSIYSALKDKNLNKLKTLPTSSEIDASFLFEEPLTMEETLNLFETAAFPIESNYRVNWFSVANPNFSLGFDWFGTFPILQEAAGKSDPYLVSLNEKYPQLLPNAAQSQTIESYPKAMEDHFISSLSYILDNQESFEKLETQYSFELLENSLDYIKEHGVKINGVYLSGTTDAIIKFGEKNQVLNIDILGTSLFSSSYSN